MPKHIHAELMMQYAQDAMTTDKPWELWQFDFGSGWQEHTGSPSWFSGVKYRRKPKTVTINGFEVVQELCTENCVDCFMESLVHSGYFFESGCYPEVIERGVAHKTKESAIASCKARLGIDPESN